MADVKAATHPWSKWPSMGYLAAAGVLLTALFAVLSMTAVVREVFFIGFLGMLVAVVLNYPISFLSRFMRRGIATLLVLLAMVGTIGGFGYVAAPKIAEQGSELAEHAPQAIDKGERILRRTIQRSPIEDIAEPDQIENTLRTKLQEQSGKIAQKALPLAFGMVSAISGFLLLIVLAFFLVYEPQNYAEGIVRLVPKTHEVATREYLSRLTLALQGWVYGTVLSMTFVGVLTAVGLLLLGVDSWLVLAIVNFFAEFVPFLGPTLGALPGVAVGFATDTSTGFGVLVLYIAVQQFEGALLQPLIMKKAADLPPALLIVWQLLMGGAFGILGILVATPLLVVVKTTIDFWYIEQALGKTPLHDDQANRAKLLAEEVRVIAHSELAAAEEKDLHQHLARKEKEAAKAAKNGNGAEEPLAPS